MRYYLKSMAPFMAAIILFTTSCSETKTDTKEETEINKMDSTTKVLKVNKEELEAQTKKVEEALEKVDKEFESSK